MKLGDVFYIIAMIFFAWITFGIVRGNFQRKFDEQGRRKDLVDSDSEESESE
jgi:ribose 5-phosphate isomerase RpiB